MALPYIIAFVQSRQGQSGDGDAGGSGRSVCIYEDGEYALMDVEDYVSDILLGMMSSDWNDEMLRTAAVVLRTGIYYQMDEVSEDTYAATAGYERKGRLINEDSLNEIRYTEDELRNMWGNDYDRMRACAKSAVSSTHGEIVVYDGKAIIPVYHMVSIGHTVSAQELYGSDIPYLKRVDSDADRLAEGFTETVVYSEDRIEKVFGCSPGESGNEISVTKATESGFANVINVYGTEVDAEEFRTKLGLQSTNIHIDRTDDGYRIITVGIGDSLGLSLYGASVLAENGQTYRAILSYYYSNTTVE